MIESFLADDNYFCRYCVVRFNSHCHSQRLTKCMAPPSSAIPYWAKDFFLFINKDNYFVKLL